MGKGKLKVQFLSFFFPLKLTEFNFSLTFFQGLSLDRQGKRRIKTRYTEEQSAMLEDLFWENHFPTWKERCQISEKLVNVGEDRTLV